MLLCIFKWPKYPKMGNVFLYFNIEFSQDSVSNKNNIICESFRYAIRVNVYTESICIFNYYKMFTMIQQIQFMISVLLIKESFLSNICKSGSESGPFLSSWVQVALTKYSKSSNTCGAFSRCWDRWKISF